MLLQSNTDFFFFGVAPLWMIRIGLNVYCVSHPNSARKGLFDRYLGMKEESEESYVQYVLYESRLSLALWLFSPGSMSQCVLMLKPFLCLTRCRTVSSLITMFDFALVYVMSEYLIHECRLERRKHRASPWIFDWHHRHSLTVGSTSVGKSCSETTLTLKMSICKKLYSPTFLLKQLFISYMRQALSRQCNFPI